MQYAEHVISHINLVYISGKHLIGTVIVIIATAVMLIVSWIIGCTNGVTQTCPINTTRLFLMELQTIGSLVL